MNAYIFLQHYWWFVVSLLGALLVFLLFVQGGNSLLLDVNKSGVISTVKSIRKRLKEIDTLTQLPQLREFFNEYNSLKETFNTLLQDAECFNHSSEYADIDTKLKNAIKTACVDFSRKQTAEIKQIIQTPAIVPIK